MGEYSYPAGGNQNRERSAADLLRDIVGNVQEIIRSEVRLAKAEVREGAAKGMSAVKLLAAGGVLALYALGFILLSFVHLLSAVVAPWLASLIVGLVVGGIAVALAMAGKGRLSEMNAKPDKTIQNVKENVAWMKDQTKS